MIVREVGDRSGIAASLEGLAVSSPKNMTSNGRLASTERRPPCARRSGRPAPSRRRPPTPSSSHRYAADWLRMRSAAAFAQGRALLPEEAAAEALQPRQP